MKGSILEARCGRWWVKGLLASTPIAALSLYLPFTGLHGPLTLGAMLAASIIAGRMVGSPLIAVAVWSSAWYGSPWELVEVPYPLSHPLITFTLGALLGLAASMTSPRRGPTIDPVLEPLAWGARPRPTPLAAASISLVFFWLAGPLTYQDELSYMPALWAVTGALAASLHTTSTPASLLAGLLAGLGPAGALVTLTLTASMPYCYTCPQGVELNGDLVAVVARTSPLRGASTLPDGRVVACALGTPAVMEEHVEAQGLKKAAEAGAVFAGELGDPLVRGFLASGGAIAQPGCRGESILYRPRGSVM